MLSKQPNGTEGWKKTAVLIKKNFQVSSLHINQSTFGNFEKFGGEQVLNNLKVGNKH